MLDKLKEHGEEMGRPLLIVALALLVIAFFLTCSRWLIVDPITKEKILTSALTTLAIAIGASSVGLGFISIGMSAKSEGRQTELLGKLDESITRLPLMFTGDILTPTGQRVAKQVAKEEASKSSKEAAQKRLDEDTQKVGYQRGEIYQTDGGLWAIHWGGKYPL